jgi:peptide/nickel transport system substrate-binding protein
MRKLTFMGLLFVMLGIVSLCLIPQAVAKSDEAFEVTVGLEGDVLSFDPYVYDETISNAICDHVYEALALTDNNLQSVPGLAERWEISDDLLTWTFYLRKGVKFHNGNEFTADDVIFSFDRAQEPFSKYSQVFGSVKDYKKLDDYTVVINFTAPDVAFLSRIRTLSILDKESFEGKDEGYIALHPNGTGKYKLAEYVREDRIVFARNEDYWGNKPQVTKAIYKPITNDATRTANILSGNVDLIVNVPVRDVDRLGKNPDLNIIQQPGLRVIYLNYAGWTDNPSPDTKYPIISPKGDNPFKSLKVRQAIRHAINIDEIVERIMNGFATPTATYCPEFFIGYNPDIKIPEYNPELAMKLLDESGYPVQDSGQLKGYRFQVTLDAPNDRYVNDAQVAQAIAGYLEKVGIKVYLNLMSRNIFFTYIRTSNPMGDITHFLMTGWADSSGEGVTMAADLLYSYDQTGPVKEGFGDVNRGYYKNPEVDRLIDEALATKDVDKRAELVKKVWEIAHNDVAYIPLYFEQDIFAARKNIKYTPMPNKYVYAWNIEPVE